MTSEVKKGGIQPPPNILDCNIFCQAFATGQGPISPISPGTESDHDGIPSSLPRPARPQNSENTQENPDTEENPAQEYTAPPGNSSEPLKTPSVDLNQATLKPFSIVNIHPVTLVLD